MVGLLVLYPLTSVPTAHRSAVLRSAAGLPTIVAKPTHAASVSFDFGYRLERAMDPDKREPATEDEVGGGYDALMAMCNPEPPEPPLAEAQQPAASQVADAFTGLAASSSTASTAGLSGAAAAVVAQPPAEPASSAEPLVRALVSSDCGTAITAVMPLDALAIVVGLAAVLMAAAVVHAVAASASYLRSAPV